MTNKKKFNIKRFIYKFYCYVPPCPACEGKKTGYYVKSTHQNDILIRNALKNGEIIDMLPKISENNCFCLECGFEWPENISNELHSLEYIENEKKKRETNVLLKAALVNKDTNEKELKKKLPFILNEARKIIGRI